MPLHLPLACRCVIPAHDDVIKWKHFPRYWPFVRGIHRSPVNSPHKGQWRGALMFSLICTRINGWVNNGEAGDLRRHRAHYDVTVMCLIYQAQRRICASVLDHHWRNRRQGNAGTSADLASVGPWCTYFNDSRIKSKQFASRKFRKLYLKQKIANAPELLQSCTKQTISLPLV